MPDPYRVLVTGASAWEDEEAVRFEIAGLTMPHPGLTVADV